MLGRSEATPFWLAHSCRGPPSPALPASTCQQTRIVYCQKRSTIHCQQRGAFHCQQKDEETISLHEETIPLHEETVSVHEETVVGRYDDMSQFAVMKSTATGQYSCQSSVGSLTLLLWLYNRESVS